MRAFPVAVSVLPAGGSTDIAASLQLLIAQGIAILANPRASAYNGDTEFIFRPKASGQRKQALPALPRWSGSGEDVAGRRLSVTRQGATIQADARNPQAGGLLPRPPATSAGSLYSVRPHTK
jgi:hypothetical protein